MYQKTILLSICAVLLLVGSAFAQKDDDGAVDTIYAESYRIDDKTWAINVSVFNDEEILAISLPMKFSAGTTKIYADSTVFTGGRVEHFRVKNARSDSATQCVTIGLINDIGVSVPPMAPGKGRIATIFISSIDGSKVEALDVDTTTTPPGNSMQMVKPKVIEIIPAFVYKATETKAEKEE
jgi:hypothetical protein